MVLFADGCVHVYENEVSDQTKYVKVLGTGTTITQNHMIL